MDNYFTIEEKYLQAVEEMHYGETPLSLKLLNEILAEDPSFVRAHYQIGKLYYYDLHDYQSAGYHFKLCTDLEPAFPDVYFHYISLLLFLNMERQLNAVGQKAITVPGVNASAIYNLMGLCAEKNRKLKEAMAFYHEGLMLVTANDKKTEIEENISRIRFKVEKSKTYSYHFSN
ncbi:tetratricopeptide repeat protein [Mucilaginibacter sp. AW1-3]